MSYLTSTTVRTVATTMGSWYGQRVVLTYLPGYLAQRAVNSVATELLSFGLPESLSTWVGRAVAPTWVPDGVSYAAGWAGAAGAGIGAAGANIALFVANKVCSVVSGFFSSTPEPEHVAAAMPQEALKADT